ncbi:hypothetical protein ES319_A12G190900v1 [Gossypium barbadense]|uniref:Uncharacterized protein n=3 Tax=Gossypium TaxID=3633 RepID=A0A5J5TC29_GOSBA|nr:hypothetical protein ES319_A12G190900v1 [Gossypium barbadense]TYG90760.1 hypothetical protein ES288_A12G208300v1 [Gossypium darwinii]
MTAAPPPFPVTNDARRWVRLAPFWSTSKGPTSKTRKRRREETLSPFWAPLWRQRRALRCHSRGVQVTRAVRRV